MAERHLAHIELVHDIEPIEGADRIEYAHVLGWGLVVGKGEFKEGDKCVYFEIDSKVDTTKPVFAFMENNGGKVKTRKFKGKISQGLALSLDKFDVDLSKYHVGDDVTKILGVTKIQTQEELRLKADAQDPRESRVKQRYAKFIKSKFGKWIMGHKFTRQLFLFIFGGKKKNRGNWPSFVTKTDEERIENMPQMLQNKKPLEVTEKLDGTSTTFFLLKKGRKKFEFGVCSRNVRQFDENQKTYHDHNIYWDMAFKYDVETVLKKLFVLLDAKSYIVLQGESVGSVQGNPLKLSEDQFFGFNLIIDGVKMDSVKAKEKVELFGIQWVPILQTDFICPDTMDEMKKLATAKSVVNPNVMREGCVYRDADNTISFKNVSTEYLLKHQE